MGGEREGGRPERKKETEEESPEVIYLRLIPSASANASDPRLLCSAVENSVT